MSNFKNFYEPFSKRSKNLLKQLLVYSKHNRPDWRDLLKTKIMLDSFQVESSVPSQEFAFRYIDRYTKLRDQKKSDEKNPFTFQIAKSCSREIKMIFKILQHELSKYVYVLMIYEKGRAMLEQEEFRKIYTKLIQLNFVLLRQKFCRVQDIEKGFEKKGNFLYCKNPKHFQMFLDWKKSEEFKNYFKNLAKMYDTRLKQISLILDSIDPSERANLPNASITPFGFKKVQKDLWNELNKFCEELEKTNNSINFNVNIKHFYLYLLELLRIIKLSTNFPYHSEESMRFFKWSNYFKNLNAYDIKEIIEKINDLKEKHDYTKIAQLKNKEKTKLFG